MKKRRTRKSSTGGNGSGSSKFSLKKVQEPAINTGAAIGGLVIAHAAGKAIKKNTPAINAAALGGGIISQAFVKQGWLKALLLGVGVYGGVRLANNLTAVAVTTEGLSGLPENVKNTIRNIFPTLGEVSGDDEVLQAIEDEIMGLAATNPAALKHYRPMHSRCALPGLPAASSNFTPGQPVNVAGLGNIISMF